MSTWVLLRGLIRESRHWGEFPELLRRELPEADVITLDLPGNGSLSHMRSPARIEQMAEHCRRALAEKGFKPPYNLLAQSMGGMVAMAWQAAYPREIGNAVLISTSVRPHSAFYRRLRPQSYPLLARMMLSSRDPRRAEARILRIISSRGEQQPQVLDAWAGYARERPVSRVNALRQLLAAARFRDPGAAGRGPVLLLAGARDHLVDPACSRALARAWNAELAIHPDAGHDVPLDDGPWVAAQVRTWLERRLGA